MDVRITHHHEPGYGWSFDSPDLPGLVGGVESDDFAAARIQAEEAVRFHLESVAEETGEPAPHDVTVEHFVPASAVAVFAWSLPIAGSP